MMKLRVVHYDASHYTFTASLPLGQVLLFMVFTYLIYLAVDGDGWKGI